MKQEFLKKKTKKSKHFSIPILSVLLTILFLGSLMIFSASYPYAKTHYEDGFYYIKRHLIFLTLGILAMLIVSKVNVRFIKKISPFFYGFWLILLVLVLFKGF